MTNFLDNIHPRWTSQYHSLSDGKKIFTRLKGPHNEIIYSEIIREDPEPSNLFPRENGKSYFGINRVTYMPVSEKKLPIAKVNQVYMIDEDKVFPVNSEESYHGIFADSKSRRMYKECCMLGAFCYHKPTSIEEAIELLFPERIGQLKIKQVA